MMKGGGSAGPKEEGEANIWSSDILIPSGEMLSFMRKFVGTAAEVVAFAKAQGIAPGIVVGQLQYNKAVSFAALNDLKVRYAWSE